MDWANTSLRHQLGDYWIFYNLENLDKANSRIVVDIETISTFPVADIVNVAENRLYIELGASRYDYLVL